MSHSTSDLYKRNFLGQPIGLYILFLTEMWERFSYYGMRAILVLYLTSLTKAENSGLGWTSNEALALYGWYTMLVYVMSIPGGIIADKWLGQKKSVLFGGILLVFGHGILAIEQSWAFYSGLSLIVLGVGLLKPNISTMVGGLYKEGDLRRDKGFTIFYIGINLGAFLSGIIVGTIGEIYGWHYGFGLAGIGMLIGLLVFIYGQKYLTDVGNKNNISKDKDEASLGDLIKQLFVSPIQLGVFATLIFISIYAWISFDGADNWAYGLLFIFLSFVVGIMMMIYKDLKTQVAKDRFIVILLTFILVIVFWGAFEQAGGLMNIYANEKTNRVLLGLTVPATWFQSLNPFYIVVFGTTVAGFWARRKLKGKQASSIFKMAVGVIIMGLGFVFMSFASLQFENQGQSAMYWLILAYLFHTIGELSSSPVALSFITKLAPVKYASLMMGAYFAATGLGNKVSGILGESATDIGELNLFTLITLFTVLFGLIVILMLKPLKRLTHGVEDKEKDLTFV
jgi:POT family proton-dependent oligopeptide transporter